MIDAKAGIRALSVDRVTKNFGGLFAVDALSFDMAEHEVLGLIGPNGSGKTTMVNLISGALQPSAGSLRLFANDITNAPPAQIARMGIARTFQIVRILPSLTVLENVAAGGVFGHERRWGAELDAHARDMLHRVGLEGAEHNPVSALTYIDQKRLELARALVSNPKVLLLDEWLAGLNPTELQTGIELIRELRAEGGEVVEYNRIHDVFKPLRYF